MDTVKQLRTDILEILFKVNDVTTLEKICDDLKIIYRTFSEPEKEKKEEALPLFMKGVKPIRKEITLEMLMLEQNYKPITYQEFRASADQIEWEESLEELLAAL